MIMIFSLQMIIILILFFNYLFLFMIIALNFTQNSKNRALRNGVEYLRYPNNVQKNVGFLDLLF